jgi:hypothetical protein
MRCEDDTFEVMSRCVWIMSNLTWKIINRKTLRRLCKYIIVIFEYFLTTTNALFHGNFQKSLNSTWRLKIFLRPLTKIKNRVYELYYYLHAWRWMNERPNAFGQAGRLGVSPKACTWQSSHHSNKCPFCTVCNKFVAFVKNWQWQWLIGISWIQTVVFSKVSLN